MFSPYYAWSGRRDPENHVGINVALYGPRSNRWAMTERGRGALARAPDRFQVGASGLEWRDDRLRISFDEMSVPRPPAQLLPRRIRGTVELFPHALTGRTFSLDAAGTHLWSPIAPHARAEVTIEDGGTLHWRGNGYVDSNCGTEPLERGFRRWDWARGRRGDAGTVILYDALRRDGSRMSMAVRVDDDGAFETVAMPDPVVLPRGLWSVRRAIASAPEARPRVLRTYEDSPFYVRSLVTTRLFDSDIAMVHESFDGDRFASPVVRLMLPFRMPRWA